ncbi:hypothetical protein KJ903_02090 [Patescibacteria group bacterium]|nr:hypothetical protein [Patescibacteria group bacterium]
MNQGENDEPPGRGFFDPLSAKQRSELLQLNNSYQKKPILCWPFLFIFEIS